MDQAPDRVRPNILLICTDQQRWDWMGCAGTPGVETPNIDALAASGVRITGHVTNSAVCVPARIGLATGITPARLGCLGNDAVLPADVPTYYQALRDGGYRVGVVGKLDLNKPDEFNGRRGDRPDTYRWGFTHPVEAEGKMHAANWSGGKPLGPYGFWLQEQGLFEAFNRDYGERLEEIYARYFDPELSDRPFTGSRWYADSVLPAEAFEDAWIGRRSCEWLREVPDEYPFHLMVSFVGPHDPFDPPTEYAQRFRDAAVPAPVLDSNEGRPATARSRETGHTEQQIIEARRQYTAALAVIDDQVGEIMATLADSRLSDRTIVLFTSDHGEMLGDHRLFQKHVAYEPSMRVPLIASGPGIGTGISDALTELVDVPATILDFAGVQFPGPIDGRSLRAVLKDPTAAHREAVTCCEGHYRAIRTTTEKYIRNLGAADTTDEFYDLTDDPNETRNLINDEAARVEELAAQLEMILGPEATA